MIEERLKHARTGHRDCCGDMIRRRDTVITRDGVGRVVWAGSKWWVRYQGRPTEALNKYPAAELRRVSEHEDCHGIVQSIKRSQSVGYITNVTK